MDKRAFKKRINLDKELVFDFLSFGGASFFEQATRLLLNFSIAIFLGPFWLGTWQTLNLLIRYSNFSHLGSLNGLNREISLNLENQNYQYNIVSRNRDIIVLIFIAHISLWIISLFFDSKRILGIERLDISLTIILSFVSQFFGLVKSKLRAEIKFRLLGRFQIIFSFLWLIFGLIALKYSSLTTFLLCSILINILVVLISDRQFVKTVWFSFFDKIDIAALKRNIHIGFPIMLVGFSHILFTTVDRVVVLNFFDLKVLGYYSIATILLSGESIIVLLFSQLYYPRILKAWSGDTFTYLKRLVRDQQLISVIALLPVCGLIFFLSPYLIENYFPEYIPSIQMIKIICFAPIFLAVSNAYGNLMNAIKKQNVYLIILALSTSLNLCLNYYFLLNGFSIEYVAISTLIAYVFYGVTSLLIGDYLMKKNVSCSISNKS